MFIVLGLRSLLFNFIATLYTLGCLVCVAVFPVSQANVFARRWAQGIMGLAQIILGLSYQFITPPYWSKYHKPLLIACKHQSTWETIIFFALLNQPVYIMKDSLLRVPLLGRCLRKLGMISVKRQGSSLTSMLQQAQEAYHRGYSLIIFPEGTRRAPFSPTRYFKGIYHLAKKLECSVTPMALNSGCFWARRSWIKRSGCITLQALDPLPFIDSEADFMAELASRIEIASTKLCQKSI